MIPLLLSRHFWVLFCFLTPIYWRWNHWNWMGTIWLARLLSCWLAIHWTKEPFVSEARVWFDPHLDVNHWLHDGWANSYRSDKSRLCFLCWWKNTSTHSEKAKYATTNTIIWLTGTRGPRKFYSYVYASVSLSGCVRLMSIHRCWDA